jgi:hypothetical protein
MRGSIRTLVGLFIVLGSAGGLDNATDSQLPFVIAFAALGLFMMYSGTKAMKELK